MKFKQFLINTCDPKQPDAQRYFTYSYHSYCNGPSAMQQEWQHYLDYLSNKIIGRPKGSRRYSVAQLEAEHMVGVYTTMSLQQFLQYRWMLVKHWCAERIRQLN